MLASAARDRTLPRALLPVAAGAAVVALAARHAAGPLHFVLLAGFGLALVALAERDAATMLLPNRIMYPALAAALICVGAWPDHSWAAGLAGGAVGGAIMFALFVVMPGFGAGDVKLCALMGLLLGWPHILAALVTGVVLNGIVAAVGLATGRLRVKGTMPYGPGLIAGALLTMLLSRA